ncbi:MAG TPA: hypothetical protein VE955_12530 [Candidatus Dormibacteraeota bacterium]|nr:hypothetical protein [Candidatus Dormibacteraeota bacterium]
MKLPSRRVLGATALIVAGIAAFMVPYLLRSPTSGQGTSPTSPGGNNNNNNGGGTTTTTTTSGNGGGSNNGNGNGNGKGGGSGNCAENQSQDPKTHDPNPHGNAWGVIKNKLDTTVATVKAMGTHDPAFHLHHDTDTDNAASQATHGHSHNSGDPDSSCAAAEEAHDKD